ncbi:hypothetical protein GBAR_LOCUS17453 [Geodia barretti]|uniref:Uncharacterized protein n=1 Tax=Geodia barretti TaxID=519541 RepID=A0AA35SIL5_GEOBA|nr:hypothetical protein GBAR_LOCUS17453 [Geodia barretti]
MQGLPGLVIFTFHCGIVYSVMQVHQVQEKNFQNWFGGNNIIRSKLSSGVLLSRVVWRKPPS